MHCKNPITIFGLFLVLGHVIARPTSLPLDSRAPGSFLNIEHTASLRQRNQITPLSCSTAPAAVAEERKEGAVTEEGATAGEEAAKENEVEIESKFDTAVDVQGGDLKQDLVFTPSTVGKFEYEFQGKTADKITVTENTKPAAPPAGFEAIEKNSYKVSLAASKGAGLTLSKIDYIFDTTAAGIQGKDITKAQVGRLCAETGAFVISETLGGLEFEAEENEVTLNLNKNVTAEGEWGIFLPIAAAAAGGAEAPKGNTPKKGSKKTNKNSGKKEGDEDDSDD